jgi:hypothetical protein
VLEPYCRSGIDVSGEVRPTDHLGDPLASAIRFRIAVNPDRAVEVSRLPLEKRIPGGDNLPPRPLAGLWVDLVNSDGKIVYSKVLDAVPDGTREAFPPRGTPIVRVPDPDENRQYVVFVPADLASGGRVVVNSSGRGPDARTARPIGEFTL